MKRINCLVTGSTGLVGAHLLAHLLQSQQFTVRAMKRKSSKMDTLRYVFGFYTDDVSGYVDSISWVDGDVLDTHSLLTAMDGVQVIFHCAADVFIGNDTANSVLQTNVQGTKNMVDAALSIQVQTFCHVSSVAAIGKDLIASLSDENSPWDMNKTHTAYAQSKYDAEQVVLAIPQQKMRVIIVNPGVILGVNNKNTGSSSVIFLAKKGFPFYIHGGSGYVDVRDVCRAMLLLVQRNVTHERFVLVGENCTTKQLLRYFSEGLDTPRPSILVPKPLLMLVGYLAEIVSSLFKIKSNFDRKAVQVASQTSYYNAEKIQKRFNFQFTPLQQCVKDICMYVK